MSNAEDLQALEITIEEAKAKIARKDCLARLQANPDFRELIEKGFLEKHAIRQVMLKAHPGRQSEKDQAEHDRQIIAIGEFQQYLIAIYTHGIMAMNELADHETAQEEILQEDLTNG